MNDQGWPRLCLARVDVENERMERKYCYGNGILNGKWNGVEIEMERNELRQSE